MTRRADAIPATSIAIAEARKLAEHICEAAADEFRILDDPVLMAPGRRIQDAKAVAAAALSLLGISSYVITDLLNYASQDTCFYAIKRADDRLADKVLGAVGMRRQP